jgi:DNA-binding MarR family transcriptional regulator
MHMIDMISRDAAPPATYVAEPAAYCACLDTLLLTFQAQGRLSNLLAAESRAFNLTPSEALALITLARDSSPVSGIARAVGIRPNGASVLVDRLKERKLVRRQRSRRDNRVVTVDLTDAGREIADALAKKATDQMEFALTALSSDERERFVGMLRQVAAAGIRV